MIEIEIARRQAKALERIADVLEGLMGNLFEDAYQQAKREVEVAPQGEAAESQTSAPEIAEGADTQQRRLFSDDGLPLPQNLRDEVKSL